MTTDAQPPASERYSEGDVVGAKYRLVRRLDEGGMGEVWIARHRDLDVHVAIKLVRHELASFDTAQRLLEEARIVARLEHPGIVRVTDVGMTQQGDAFIVMELLHGELLADVIARRGALDELRAVELVLPLADALALAHDSGIIHRDLKPENIFLAELKNGRLQPKVLDFGIAFSASEASLLSAGAGAVVGSPGYMSPEQACGYEVDGRSDVWAFSVVLYEAIAGILPFEGEDYHAMLRAIVEDEPVPLTGLVDCDPAIWAIIRRGLRKQPVERWQSMRTLGAELARWLLSRGIQRDATGTSLHSVWPEIELPASVPPIALPQSTPPASSGEPPSRPVNLTTHGRGAVSVARPDAAAARARFSLAALLCGVLLGAGALALYGALRAGDDSAPRVAAPPPATSLSVPPERPAPSTREEAAPAPRDPAPPEAPRVEPAAAPSAERPASAAPDAGTAPRPRPAPRAPRPSEDAYRPREL